MCFQQPHDINHSPQTTNRLDIHTLGNIPLQTVRKLLLSEAGSQAHPWKPAVQLTPP